MAASAQSDSSDDTVRLKSYKYKGLDFEEGRRKRQEESVSLRKSKREDQVYLCIYFLMQTQTLVSSFLIPMIYS